MKNEDNARYVHFTGPYRLEKAIHTLEGIVTGIAIDGRVNDKEMRSLTHWLSEHDEFSTRHPFNEIFPLVSEAIVDSVLDEEERADILWVCSKFSKDGAVFCKITTDMQRLQGLLAGILADGVISVDELHPLSEWLDEHLHLKTCWPYDELESLLLHVLKDHHVDKHEHDMLVHFFSQFVERPGHRSFETDECDEEGEILISGICAVCPEIRLMGNRFCLTGRSARCSRKKFANEIESRGGIFCERVTQDVDYLTIGSDGNPCWAYACYGRKVETAIKYRRSGCRILLVHENDVWDAIADGC